MAKAKASPARSKGKGANGLPEGFEPVQGFAKQWDVDTMPVLQGTWGTVRTVKFKRGKQDVESRVCDVETEDGERYSVWESATLATLFNEVEQGTEVYIRFEGFGKAKKGQNAPKLFMVATR